MAAEVDAQFTAQQYLDYGNIILNGYQTVGPNTTNKKAWQYAETTTPPVNLPSVSSVRPALKGWTTNYMEYYTRNGGGDYNQSPGNPTMFNYNVHSFRPILGPILDLQLLSYGEGYATNDYFGQPLVLKGGPAFTGIGGTVDISIDAEGKISSFSLNAPGVNYAYGNIAAINLPGSPDLINFYVSSVGTTSGGQSKWAQTPRRFNQLEVDNIAPPQYINNPRVIQYSFMYPIPDQVNTPPIDILP